MNRGLFPKEAVAVKDNGAITIRTARETSGHATLIVEDNGPGLPHGKEEALFEAFARGRNESAVTGVGLGLSIVRAIVEAHEGTVSAGNRDEGGTRFVIRLPAGNAPEVPREVVE